MSQNRRFWIVLISVLVGTAMSTGLFILRFGKLDQEKLTTLGFNLALGFALVFLIGVVLMKKKGPGEGL